MTPARLTAALASVAATAALVAGCGGDDGSADAVTAGTSVPADTSGAARTTPSEPTRAAAPGPLAGLPAESAGFMGWDRLNRAPIPPDSPQAQRVGVDAHRGVKHVYVSVSRERLSRGGAFPDDAIVVKAAGEDPARPTLVASMRKVSGSDPQHGDWQFEEYTRAAPGERFDGPLTGAVCWTCHAIASETDWVFTALER